MTNILSTPSRAGQTTWSYTAAYNQVNQRTRTTLADDSYWDYTYDDLGQLDSGGKHTSAGTQISGRQFTYDQDEIGNRISVNSSTSYTANNVNQYIAINSQNLTYDGDGNLLTDGVWTYTWDGENRLTRMVSTNLTKTLSFEYDWQGRRIAKKVWNNTTGTGTPAVYLKYLYDGWNLIAELNGNSNNAKVRTYTWGLDISGSTTEAGGVGALLMVNDASNGVHFVSYDLNGNIMGLIKATNGTISASYEYGPFGELLSNTGSMSSSNPFRFSTKYRDNETDLYYYGYRYYSPSLGRWLSHDPIEEQGGLNLYAFVNNDPVNRVDWLGQWGSDVHRDKTAQWAMEMNIAFGVANFIGITDNEIDTVFNPSIFSEENWSWHFNRSESGDSRLRHRDIHIALAKKRCTKQEDDPYGAAGLLGWALHPDQDWVAHGDFNRIHEMPNFRTTLNLPWGIRHWKQRHYWHNWDAKGVKMGDVDNPDLDAGGPQGRPTIDTMIYSQELSNKDKVCFANFHPGHERIRLTENRTKEVFQEFKIHVKQHGKHCGKCWRAYLCGYE